MPGTSRAQLIRIICLGIPLTAVLLVASGALNDARGTGHKVWDVSLHLPASMCQEGAILRIRPAQDNQPWETTIVLREDVHTYRVGLLLRNYFHSNFLGRGDFPGLNHLVATFERASPEGTPPEPVIFEDIRIEQPGWVSATVTALPSKHHSTPPAIPE